jgi:replicative DNA helicase
MRRKPLHIEEGHVRRAHEVHQMNEGDFGANDIHRVLFEVIRSAILSNESIDNVLIAEKIKNLGISFKENINIFDYLQSLSLIRITEKAFVESCQKLKTVTVRREIAEIGKNLQKTMLESGEKKFDQLISEADSIYSSKILGYDLQDEPENLFSDIEAIIEELGNNPVEESGYSTPYKQFNDFYGGLRPKNLYAFCARPKNGKSTFLADMCWKMANLVDPELHILYLDTEMEKIDQQKRLIAAITGVPFWYIDTGSWRKDKEMTEKVRKAWPIIQNYKLHHMKVGNKNINEIMSIMRRWYYSKVGRGGKALVCYDYMKMTGENVSESWKEYQVIGEKTDKFKKISEELGVPVLTSTQLNRTGENQNKKSGSFNDDSSAIALSDRLQWFASFVGIFRRKTIDEMLLDGEEFGTHKLVPTATRFQGKNASGHHDVIERNIDGQKIYQNNYISFDVKNFHVQEKGSLKEIVQKTQMKLQVFDDNGDVINQNDSSEVLF